MYRYIAYRCSCGYQDHQQQSNIVTTQAAGVIYSQYTVLCIDYI